MTGHWTYEETNEEFEDKDDMWDYLAEHEAYADELDFERWLDEEYRASQIVWRLKDESAEAVYLDLWDEFEEAWRDGAGEPVEGEDFDYNGFTFRWVEDEEE